MSTAAPLSHHRLSVISTTKAVLTAAAAGALPLAPLVLVLAWTDDIPFGNVEKIGILGALLVMLWLQGRREERESKDRALDRKALTGTADKLGDLTARIDKFVVVTEQAHKDYADARDRAVDAVTDRIGAAEERIVRAVDNVKDNHT